MITFSLRAWLLIVTLFGPAYAICGAPWDCCGDSPNIHCKSVVLRTGMFFPVDSLFRRVYDNVLECYEVELSQEQNCNWTLWENLDWFSKKGHSTVFHNPTRISVLNLSCGLKFKWEIGECLHLYLGAGASLGISWIRDKLYTGPHKLTRRIIVGGILKTDLHYYFTQNWFIDLFADYLYQPYHFYEYVDFGGAKVGGGIGYAF